MRDKRIASMAAGICALLAAAGCGGGGAENDYAAAYTAVTGKIERELGTLQSAPTTDPANLRSQLRTMAAALGDAATQFAAIKPPDAAKAGHAKVHAGVTALAADVRRSADALTDAESPTATVRALRTITSSQGPAQIEAGEQQLRRAGYEIR
jgi:hypothetical protein